MSRLNWNDPAAVAQWLGGLWVSLNDADAVTRDMLLPARERQLGPALHAERYDTAWHQIAQSMAYAGAPEPEPEPDGGEPEPPASRPRPRVRPLRRADLADAATFEGPGDSPYIRALMAWKDDDPEADARLRAACPPEVDPDELIAGMRRKLDEPDGDGGGGRSA
jgi:hypothetical protein